MISKVDYKSEILRSIRSTVDRSIANCRVDRTYESVIKDITPKGYVVLDESGSERIVGCCIPGLQLQVMQRVWVKEPLGNIKRLHICGVI